ncbi:MAG TPA: dihydropteroate synthase [Terriglobales bacterium]|nr:dihydropteroate synthase [Terriglobales bacterium]
MRQVFQWQLGSRSLELGRRTLVMGIVNVTPDSFSDGGQFFDRNLAVEHGLRLMEDGADILDVGGESTRPGAGVQGSERKPSVSAGDELARVVPVIEELKRRRPESVISVDTYKAAVATKAVQGGAEIVNDVSGFLWDQEMAATCAGLSCGVVLMHMRGLPETWRSLPRLDDPIGLVQRELKERADAAVAAGVVRERIVIDPGFGFGKNYEENYPLLSGMDELAGLGLPIMAGTSRKSFVGRAMGSDAPPSERLHGSLAAMALSIVKGAHIVRVHDVKQSVEAARVVDAILQNELAASK